MNKTIGTIFLLLVSSAFKGLRTSHSDGMALTRLKISLMYVRSIKTCRLLFLSILGIGVCLTFLLAAIALLHVSLFLYAPWSAGTKMLVGLLCSGVYLGATLIIFYQIFSSDNWLKIFNADTIMDHLRKEAVPQDNTPME